MAEKYYSLQDNLILNNSLSTQSSDKFENILMKVNSMKQVTTQPGASQVLFLNTKQKIAKSVGKSPQSEILTNNYISDGGLKQINMKYYNSTTFNKSNYPPTKKSSSTTTPNHNPNQMHLTSYNVSVRDNSELSVTNISKDEVNSNNSNFTKILVSNSSKDKKEIRLKADSNSEINMNNNSSNISKQAKEKKRKSNKDVSGKQPNAKNKAVSTDAKKILNPVNKKEENKGEDSTSKNYIRDGDDIDEFSRNERENIESGYSNDNKTKIAQKIIKNKNKENESKIKNGKDKSDVNKGKNNLNVLPDKRSSKISSESSRETEKEDRPKKFSTKNHLKQPLIEDNSKNEDIDDSKNKTNIEPNKSNAQYIEQRNHNTFNHIAQKKVTKSKNSFNTNQFNKEHIKLLSIEEKIELMGQLVRNKEEEIIKQVQKEVIEKSKQTNEKIQRKLRYLNDRNMLDNINLEEIELGIDHKDVELNENNEDINEDINEDFNEGNEENNIEKDEDEDQNINEIEETRLKPNYTEGSSSLNKPKRSKSSPHVPLPAVYKKISKPRINTKEYIKQINNERRIYFENEENNSRINPETEIVVREDYSNVEEVHHDKSENMKISVNQTNNENNSFRKSSFIDQYDKSKAKTAQRSASASPSINSKILEQNDNLDENYKFLQQSNIPNYKRSNAEVQEFIMRKRREDKQKAIKLRDEKDEKSLKKLVQLTKIAETQDRIFRRQNYSHSQNPNIVNTTKTKNSEYSRYQEEVKKSHSSNKIKNEMYIGKKKKNPNDSSVIDPDEYYLMLLESKNILDPHEERIQASRKHSDIKEKFDIDQVKHSFKHEHSYQKVLSENKQYKSMNSENSFKIKQRSKENSIQLLQESGHKSVSLSNQKELENSYQSEVKSVHNKQPSKNNDDFNRLIDIKQKSMTNSNDILSIKSQRNEKIESSSYRQCDTAFFNSTGKINEKLDEIKAKVSEFKQRAINLRENNNIKLDTSKSLSKYSIESNKHLSNRKQDSMAEEISHRKDKMQSLVESIVNAEDLRFSDDAFNYDEEHVYSRVKSDYNNYNEEDAYNKILSVSESNLPFKIDEKRGRIDSEVEMNLKSCDMNAINSNTSYINQEYQNNSQISLKSKQSYRQDDICNPVAVDSGILNTFSRQITSVFQRQFLSQFFNYIGMINKLDQYCEAFNYLEVISDGFIAKNAYISFQMINQHAIMKNYYEVFNLFSIASKRDAFRKVREYSEIVKLYEEEEMQVYETYLNSLCLFAKRNAFSKLKEFAFEEVENGDEEDVDNLIELYTISFNKLFLPWKRNLFFEFLNNMYQLAMTPRHLVKDNQSNNEEGNITVHINREQSPSNSQLWYNNDEDEEVGFQDTNLQIKDKSIRSNNKESLTDDILIESVGNITNKSQNFNQSIEADLKSINRSKMQMFDKNAVMNNKTISMNESKESLTEKFSGRFKNIKNNTFVHESFTERSLLMEYNSFDSPKLHRIHMLVEQQKRATQGASQDESNILNNISNNISERNADYMNNKSEFYQDQNNDYSNDNSNIQSYNYLKDNKSQDQASLINLNNNTKQNQSKNYSINSNRSLDIHNSKELNIENKINSQIKATNNSLDISGRNAVNNSYNSRTSTLNKFNNVCNSQSNRADMSQDEISQNISERINDSRNISHVSSRLNRINSEDDISVDKNGCSDIDWINTVSISKSSSSFHDTYINNSIRNSLNLASYVDNQINKSVDNSSINKFVVVPLVEKLNPSEIIVADIAPQDRENIVDEEIEEGTDEEYGKFEENIEIEIDEANDKDLFIILDEDENVHISDMHDDNQKNMNDNSNQNIQENLNANSHNNSNNFNKSRNISDNKIHEAAHVEKKIGDNLSKNVSLDNISYNELEKFDQSSYISLKDNLSKSLSQLTNKDNDIENDRIEDEEAIIDVQDQYNSNETDEKIILDENNANDKITIETANDEESPRKITKQEFMSIKIENNMLTIESNDGDRESTILKPSTTNGMKCYNLLDDKSSKNNHSSIIQLTDSDFNTLDNKENHLKEHQTLSANKRYEEMTEIDEYKLNSLPFHLDGDTDNQAIISSTADVLLNKLNNIDSFDLSSFADLLTDSIIKDIFFSEIIQESKALTPKKSFLREKDFLSTKKDDSYTLNPNNLTNDSLSIYSSTSNNTNSSMFCKTIIEHKKEASLNLYQDKIANSLITLITDSIQANYKTILNNLSQPLMNKAADIIQAITYRDYKTLRKSHKVLPDTIKDFTFLNKKEILPNFEDKNKKIREEDNITSDNYYDNILNECVVEAANELLKKERKYGDLGEPLPWSTRTHLVRYKYNESSANVVKKHIADELVGAIQFKMGLITENNENMEFDMLNSERERRLLSSIVKEVKKMFL